MKIIPIALAPQFSAETSTLAVAWKVKRLDGQVYGFTSTDQDVEVHAAFPIETGGMAANYPPVTDAKGDFIYIPSGSTTLNASLADGSFYKAIPIDVNYTVGRLANGLIIANKWGSTRIVLIDKGVIWKEIPLPGNNDTVYHLASAPGGGQVRGVMSKTAVGTHFAIFNENDNTWAQNTTLALPVLPPHITVNDNGDCVATGDWFSNQRGSVYYWPSGGNPVYFNNTNAKEYRGCQWSSQDNLIYLVDAAANPRVIEVRTSANVLQGTITGLAPAGRQIALTQDTDGFIYAWADDKMYKIINGAVVEDLGSIGWRATHDANFYRSPNGEFITQRNNIPTTSAGVAHPTVFGQRIVFEDYEAATGFTPSQLQWTSQLNVDNLDIKSIIHSDSITEDDINAGLWDDAEVWISYLNYKDPRAGFAKLVRGSIGEIRNGQTTFTAEFRGMMSHFQQTVGRLYGAACDADLGDDRCRVNLIPFTVTGTVSVVTNDKEFTDVSRTEADTWFQAGKLTWLTGANAGLSMEVKSWTLATKKFVLQAMMPYPIGAGDTYSVYAGCLKRKIPDCKDKFGNILNNRSFDLVPGGDWQMSGVS